MVFLSYNKYIKLKQRRKEMKLLLKTILYLIGGWFFTVPTIIISAIHLTITFTKFTLKMIALPFKLVYNMIEGVTK